MVTKAKKEIAHEILDKDENSDKVSARYTKVGSHTQISGMPFKLKDKIIYPINVCPHCSSEATYHRRIQESGDVVGNVWQAREGQSQTGYVLMKFDYCLDCHKEFLIELYVWEKVN